MRVLIIGAGDVGLPIIHYLSERGHLLTVIEKDETHCKHIVDHSDAAIFFGDGSDSQIWKKLEADKMDVLMALTNDDNTNIAACKMAKMEYGIPFIVARAHQPEYLEKVKEAGADVAICPSLETRRLFLNAIESRTVETIYEQTGVDFKIVTVIVPQNGSVIGQAIEKCDIPHKCKIASVFRNGTFIFPSESFMFKGGDKVLVLGSSESVEKAAEILRNIEIT